MEHPAAGLFFAWLKRCDYCDVLLLTWSFHELWKFHHWTSDNGSIWTVDLECLPCGTGEGRKGKKVIICFKLKARSPCCAWSQLCSRFGPCNFPSLIIHSREVPLSLWSGHINRITKLSGKNKKQYSLCKIKPPPVLSCQLCRAAWWISRTPRAT